MALFIPLGGVSMIDAEGQPFHDPAFAAALADKLHEHYETWIEQDDEAGGVNGTRRSAEPAACSDQGR